MPAMSGEHRAEPSIPSAAPPDEPHLVFSRGESYPRAIAWLGFKSFWGHLWHLAASVIATEDIDARQWMQADAPEALTGRMATVLGAAREGAASLTEHLDRDLWIDFIADTGDDADVSAAVADVVFREYAVDGERLPRGDVLLFGGDTAYPVATELEIHNRVCVPFNRVLRERSDGTTRVLLGIPGNHDWYDGCDGFSRMFRARRGRVDRASMTLDETEVDRQGQIGHFIEWVEAFRVGDNVAKRAALPLLGYVPVQSASYFCARLAPELDVWGVDRQLRVVDYTQRSFFMDERAARRGRIVVLADPVHAMLEPYAIGHRTFESLDLDLERDAPLVLTGDTHHYCRQRFGDAMHVIAGGGGAFLHPARIWRRDRTPPEAEFPGPRASLALALQVPWQIAAGRAGFVVHAAAALAYLPIFVAHLFGLGAHAVVGLVATVICALIGGWRQRRTWLIVALAFLCGLWVAAVPLLVEWLLGRLGAAALGETWQLASSLVLSVFPAALGFGTFLMALTLTGLEQHQAFSALAHPGYKHFVRLRVRKDGSAVDGWVLGKVDTLDPKSEIVLVDRFNWKNPHVPPIHP
jgi:hypothetical protein